MSPVLRAKQMEKLGAATWHDHFHEVPEGPMVLVANEFFDAIPIRQFERRHGQWFERVIGLGGENLQIGLVASDDLSGQAPQGRDGDIIEFAPARSDIAWLIGARLNGFPGAALIIDYGHLTSAPGDTLQAMHHHKYAAVTDSPGECDLTSHVDFEALAKALGNGGAQVAAAITQRDFLLAMGLEARVAVLSAKADAVTRDSLERAKSRLADPGQMGNLFKVLAAVSPGAETPYPFGRT